MLITHLNCHMQLMMQQQFKEEFQQVLNRQHGLYPEIQDQMLLKLQP